MMYKYGVGALAVLASSTGLALMIYGSGLLEFDIINVPSWIFGPFGAYTLIYGIVSRRDPFYYSLWGVLMLAVALAFALHAVVNPAIVAGVALIVIAILGLMAGKRVRR